MDLQVPTMLNFCNLPSDLVLCLQWDSGGLRLDLMVT